MSVLVDPHVGPFSFQISFFQIKFENGGQVAVTATHISTTFCD